ncbi:transmembrane protein [Pelomyxa schiedti]|nr:transmembrane protein [Pelomyxa schiedti]
MSNKKEEKSSLLAEAAKECPQGEDDEAAGAAAGGDTPQPQQQRQREEGGADDVETRWAALELSTGAAGRVGSGASGAADGWLGGEGGAEMAEMRGAPGDAVVVDMQEGDAGGDSGGEGRGHGGHGRSSHGGHGDHRHEHRHRHSKGDRDKERHRRQRGEEAAGEDLESGIGADDRAITEEEIVARAVGGGSAAESTTTASGMGGRLGMGMGMGSGMVPGESEIDLGRYADDGSGAATEGADGAVDDGGAATEGAEPVRLDERGLARAIAAGFTEVDQPHNLLGLWGSQSFLLMMYFIPITLALVVVLMLDWARASKDNLGPYSCPPLKAWAIIQVIIQMWFIAHHSVEIQRFFPETHPWLQNRKIQVSLSVLSKIIFVVLLVWLVVGLVWVIQTHRSDECSTLAPFLSTTCYTVAMIEVAGFGFAVLGCCCTTVLVFLRVSLYGSVMSRIPSSGAPQERILELPSFQFKRDSQDIPAGDTTCAICLTDYEEGDPVRQLPCKHHFHCSCVDKWLETSKTCPFCKKDIDAEPPTPQTPDQVGTGTVAILPETVATTDPTRTS